MTLLSCDTRRCRATGVTFADENETLTPKQDVVHFFVQCSQARSRPSERRGPGKLPKGYLFKG